MRREFVRTEDCKTGNPLDMCPWAACALGCEDGWWCFESVEDARLWESQR